VNCVIFATKNNIFKMKQLFALLILAFMINSSCKQYKLISNESEKVLVGKINRGMLNTEIYPWFKAGYDSYNSALNTDILFLKAYNQRVTFVVFGGTWCDDTRILLPKFFRVIDEAQFPASSITLFGVDRQKKTLKGEAEKNNILNVPTFIVYKDGVEIGRIVESVKKSIEVDLKTMLVKTVF